MISRFQPFVALMLFMAIAAATASEKPERGEKCWQWTLQAGAVHQFEASLDSGGDMSASRFFVSGTLPLGTSGGGHPRRYASWRGLGHSLRDMPCG